MSRLPERAREQLCRSLALTRYTDNTVVDLETLLKLLEETRRRGWAKTNEEYVKGVVGCAVPIVSPDRELIACLGVSVPVARVSFTELDRFIPPLQRAAALLSQTILQTDSEDDTFEDI
ncbi:DNA-binding IclR family transcriptional regulator [Bradyrhizobium niftali]